MMRDLAWATRVSADATDRRVASEGRTDWTPADRQWAERLRDELLAIAGDVQRMWARRQ